MILVCPNCATRYIVPDEAIGVSGRQVRCASCKHSWFQDGPQLQTREDAASATPPNPEAPGPDAGQSIASDSLPSRSAEAPLVHTAHDPVGSVDAVADEHDFDAISAQADAALERGQARAVDISGVGPTNPREVWRQENPGKGDVDPGEEETPFKPRRNPARLWTWAAVIFFVLMAIAGGALYYFGPPQWAVRAGLLADNDEPALLFYLAKPAERRSLPNGSEYFAFSARIVNSGSSPMSVPPVEVQLRDRQDRLVFSWTTKADKAELKPGEEASINESRLDIPKNAENLSLTFVDSGV